ncbi:hypothetical protein FUA48_08575 [Flavobacterium alkalisoli]|uniref:Late embryogenesis abundant protein LEA-2 subgroup domain-containing protein n=1 Tax=Flavobacterium alkalisoli TaxID=2602769 RepID=A0A5B9FRW4_9FLAO|nr:hypothetical protein [Flavobacterium alkalisoli]QEE49635.1 hypothetical protein FUA48_08575 [Flavobacterium alkalisoli]
MKAKTIIIAASIALAGIAIIGYNKVKTLKAIFDQMTIEPSGIRNFKYTVSKITFNLDITITNPTQEAFSVSGASLASLKRVMVYMGDKFIGMATVNLDAIEIPPQASLTVKNIPLEVATENAIGLLSVQNLSLDIFNIMAVVDVFGNEYTIEG